jgi:hypothetical protein
MESYGFFAVWRAFMSTRRETSSSCAKANSKGRFTLRDGCRSHGHIDRGVLEWANLSHAEISRS